MSAGRQSAGPSASRAGPVPPAPAPPPAGAGGSRRDRPAARRRRRCRHRRSGWCRGASRGCGRRGGASRATARPGAVRVMRQEQAPVAAGPVRHGEAHALHGGRGPGQVEDAVRIVVAAHEVLHPVQPREHVRAARAARLHGEVAEMPDRVLRPDDRVPGGDQRLVMGLHRAETRAGVPQDMRIAEMGVGGEVGRHRLRLFAPSRTRWSPGRGPQGEKDSGLKSRAVPPPQTKRHGRKS